MVVSDSSSDESEMPSSRENEEEEENSPPPAWGGKERKAAPTGEAEGSRKRKTPQPNYSPDAEEDEEEWPDRAKRPAKS